ncbi:MAG: hypothetical protein AAF975_09750, partial [Spirochaetota bacterium]
KPLKMFLKKEIGPRGKNWEGSYRTGQKYWTPNARGEMVERQRTNWGRKVNANPSPFRDHTQKYTGLYRLVDKPFNKTADKGIISFRIIKSNQASHKWIIPAKAGKHITRKLAYEVLPEEIRALKNDLSQEVERITEGGITWR